MDKAAHWKEKRRLFAVGNQHLAVRTLVGLRLIVGQLLRGLNPIEIKEESKEDNVSLICVYISILASYFINPMSSIAGFDSGSCVKTSRRQPSRPPAFSSFRDQPASAQSSTPPLRPPLLTLPSFIERATPLILVLCLLVHQPQASPRAELLWAAAKSSSP